MNKANAKVKAKKGRPRFVIKRPTYHTEVSEMDWVLNHPRQTNRLAVLYE